MRTHYLEYRDEHWNKRRSIASEYISGNGIEIGALHYPLRVSSGAEIRYVDRASNAQLASWYPDMVLYKFVPVDVIDDGEQLALFQDESCDFVIANHFLEHCQNPLLAMQNMLRVIKKNGVLFLSVPDKYHSFDIDRPETPLEHLISDYELGPEESRWDHYSEYVRYVHHISDENRSVILANRLIETKYSIHFHVWSQSKLFELFAYVADHSPCKLIHYVENLAEHIFVLKKI